jgi:hypothetical protein
MQVKAGAMSRGLPDAACPPRTHGFAAIFAFL